MATVDPVCSCKELTCKDILGSKILLADLEKCKKNELKFWLQCRGLKCRSADTRAELVSQVRQNLDKNLPLVDPDPGKCYTRAKNAKCVLCCTEDVQNTSDIQQPEEQVTYIDGNWSTDTSDLPKSVFFHKHCRAC
ncbi:hypothetical protein OS493_000656 [Desmophyllum pertusum]|uniref:Uncharacterized protein n=1 Tax=Desmophyllum pertusum TaxID=174260 RepID=A0A9X0A7M9_9CNID|nr:hypothetical protein OS493_000656 [Desmophyllum pertusum]